MYDYSDYTNPYINKEKAKFNTKTSKVMLASKQGRLNEVKMSLLDAMYPSSKVKFQYASDKLEDSKNDKVNVSVRSNHSNSGHNNSYEERSFDRKIGSDYLKKSVLGRFRASPYTELPKI